MLAREIRTNNSKVKLAFGGVFASLTEMQRGQPVQSPNCAMERQLDQWPNGKHEQEVGHVPDRTSEMSCPGLSFIVCAFSLQGAVRSMPNAFSKNEHY
jgi:hypothetical protein